MPNPLQVAGAQSPRPTRKAPLYQGARWSSGLFTNRAPLRDAASTRLEEKFYGPRGDAFLGGENLEISNQLTVIRRYGNSVWNNNLWENILSFSEFRLFNANTEQIKVMVDQENGLYDGSNNQQNLIWTKLPGAGQSYQQSVGNILFWGDGVSTKKWINTLQSRIPYVRTGVAQNPYNFTPDDLDTFIIDSNGNAEQLLGTILQLKSFYVLNNYAVFSLLASNSFGPLPEVSEILTPGLMVHFPTSSQFVTLTGGTAGVTLAINAIVGGISTAFVSFGGSGYHVGDTLTPSQTAAMNGVLTVASVQNASGTGYFNATVNTTTNHVGTGCTLSISTSSGGLVSAVVVSGGTNYLVGDYLFPTQSGGSNGYFIVTAENAGVVTSVSVATGAISTLNISLAGEGYESSEAVATTTLTGTGVSATVNITDDQSEFNAQYTYAGGPITSVSIVNRGAGYTTFNVVTPVEPAGSVAMGGTLQVTGILGIVGSITENSGGPVIVAYTVGAATYTTSGAGTGASFSISSVSGGDVTGINIVSPGSGFAVGDLIYLTQGSAAGAILQVATLSGSGIASISILQGGYTPYTVASGLPTTSSGIGTGATINITGVSSGSITSATLGAGGTNYTIGDKLYLNQSGATGAVFTVATLTGTVIAPEIYEHSLGPTGYPLGITLATTGGTGSGCTVVLGLITGRGLVPKYSIRIVNGGNGYSIGDVVTAVYSGSSGNMSFTVNALSPNPGPIASLSIVTPGNGYPSGQVPISGGTGTGAVININSTDFYPGTLISDTPTVFFGGNPISDSRTNSEVVWATQGNTTIDGSALWINRGPAIDGGVVYNWGLAGPTNAPTVVVNNATGGWVANTYYTQWQFIIVQVSSNFYVQQLVISGKSGSSAPSWNTTPGQKTTDGTAIWVCLPNDGDFTQSWSAGALYTSGHVLQETTSSVNCVFQLQPFTGIMTQGNGFPVYGWQCNNQSGTDVGAAGEIPSGSGNAPMAQDGGQTTSTATWSGSMDSFFMSTDGSNPVSYPVANGDGTIASSNTTLFPGEQNLSISMLPSLVIPAAGIYTFQIGHQNAMFWGIGSGSLELDVVKVEVLTNTLTITCNKNIQSILSPGVNLTFSNLQAATFLNGVTVTVVDTSAFTFTASYSHSNYGPAIDSGNAASGNTLVPSVITGPMVWILPGSHPNVYNFSTGTPIMGYPIMSANYPPQGTSLVTDTVQISFPAAGVYPCEIQRGFWYHSTSGYTTPTVSPALPGTTFSFYMIYAPPGSSTFYNIIPESIACTNASAPVWPAFPSNLAGIQAIAPNYPSVTEASGNFTWWNLGPETAFNWDASVNYTTSTFIVDPNSNQEVAYEPGVSGTTEPTFSTILYGVVNDSGSLVWMNNGPTGSTPSGELSTTQGGWQYVVALVDTLDDTVSNAGVPSISTGNFFGATGVLVSGGLPSVIDPQADYVAIFRTEDGGQTYFLIPPHDSGNGNTPYTLPLAQYLTRGFTDTTPDSGLNTLFEAPLAFQNSLPPKGSINLAFEDNRIFVSVGNTVYWSSGPDTPVGNGYNGFNPSNFAEFPSLVTRLVPLNIGMVVFTVSDIYVITGDGISGNPFISQPFEQRIGLLNYNALTVNGSIIYMMTTDNQVVELNVHSGVSEVGFPIADKLDLFSASDSYLTWHVKGSNDKCLFVADGSTGWYRMAPTAPPENGSLTWSMKANIVGGCGAIQSIETTPGNIQLLSAPPPNVSGPILYRDYNNFEDNGSTYPANFVLGSLVLAYPGQVAAPEFITTECVKVEGSQPLSLGILIGEIYNSQSEFEDLVFWGPDPPQLPPSDTLYNQRFYTSQTKKSVLCRHMVIYGEFAESNTRDELYTLSVIGSYMLEE